MSVACPLPVSAESLRPVAFLCLVSLVDRSVEVGAPEHSRFLAMLPSIRRQVRQAFRRLPSEARDEAGAETVADAFVTYARLVEPGMEDVTYRRPLPLYSNAHVRNGCWMKKRLEPLQAIVEDDEDPAATFPQQSPPASHPKSARGEGPDSWEGGAERPRGCGKLSPDAGRPLRAAPRSLERSAPRPRWPSRRAFSTSDSGT